VLLFLKVLIGETINHPFLHLQKIKAAVVHAGLFQLLNQLNPIGLSTMENFWISQSNKLLVALITHNIVEALVDVRVAFVN
jgi:hypothetical protein